MEEEKTIEDYSSKHEILLVGEGDFSFSLCLAKAFGSASNMVATSLDSKDTVIGYYPRAQDILLQLENLGCTILHGVDAHTVSKHPFLQHKRFDRIIFNFPHAGFAGFRFKEQDSPQIKRNQKLVMGFLRNAREMLREDGEIHVTHRTMYPYSEWDLETLGSSTGLYLKEEVPFYVKDYDGYSVKRGDGMKNKFNVRESSTFIFIIDSSYEALARKVASLTLEVSKLRAQAKAVGFSTHERH